MKPKSKPSIEARIAAIVRETEQNSEKHDDRQNAYRSDLIDCLRLGKVLARGYQETLETSVCSRCSGTGELQTKPCPSCYATEQKTCFSCKGTGRVKRRA